MFISIIKQFLWSYILISSLLLYLIIGCDYSKSKIAKPDMPNFLANFYSQGELDKVLRIGMSQQDVINIFGTPLVISNDLFVYRLDFNQKITKENKDAIIGFSVIFRNNKVVRWHLAYTGLA